MEKPKKSELFWFFCTWEKNQTNPKNIFPKEGPIFSHTVHALCFSNTDISLEEENASAAREREPQAIQSETFEHLFRFDNVRVVIFYRGF